MPPLSINNFTLANPISVPAHIKTTFQASGFSSAYRGFLLERLPTANIERKLILCLYCGESVGRRSTQIDHLIPVRWFCRSSLLSQTIKKKPNERVLGENVKRACVRLDNLLLACNSCNSKKGDKALDQSDIATFETVINSSQLSTDNKQTLRRKIQAAHQKIFADTFSNDYMYYKSGPGSIRHSTRVKEIHSSRVRRNPTRTRHDPMGTLELKAAREQAKKDLENAIISKLTLARPSWTTINGMQLPRERVELEKTQTLPKMTVASKLCFYCLGWYSDTAFHIDHINPTSGRVSTGHSLNVYNNSSNLIPVCRSCNTGKKDKTLTMNLIEQFIEKREKEGLAGLNGQEKQAALGRIRQIFPNI